tara:strand:- start:5944 stop:6192 length:249 start_codon:yes stop_codon:yes gene_type:complete
MSEIIHVVDGEIQGYLISEAQFIEFEDIRQSGMTNMFDVRAVAELSGGELERDDVRLIMKNYELLHKLYPNVRGGADEKEYE